MRRRRRLAACACLVMRSSGANVCPVATAGAASARDACPVGEEVEVTIWNAGRKPTRVYRVDARGREVEVGAALGAGAVVGKTGCEGTLWRARRADTLRLIGEFTQGADACGAEEPVRGGVSVSAGALDAAHGGAAREGSRWRVEECDSLPRTSPERMDVGETHATPAFELSVVHGGSVDSRARDRGPALPGPEIVADVTIDLAEAFSGGKLVEFEVKRKVVCGVCRGFGAPAEARAECDRCGGSGARLSRWAPPAGGVAETHAGVCGRCAGWGETWAAGDTCPACGGARLVDENRWFSIVLPQGVRDGWEMRREGHGDTLMDPGRGSVDQQREPGPLVLKVSVDPHPDFARVGDDLVLEDDLAPGEMLRGFGRLVEHLDGSLVAVERAEPSPPGTEIRVAGRGFRAFDDELGPQDTYGDLVLRLGLAMPKTDGDARGAEKRSFYEGLVGNLDT